VVWPERFHHQGQAIVPPPIAPIRAPTPLINPAILELLVRPVRTGMTSVVAMVIKLASWLVKSYDFTSQLRYIMWNRVENSKISKFDQTRLKSVKLGKLGLSLPSLTKLTKTMGSSHYSQSSPLHPVSLTKIPPFPFPFPQINPSRSRSHILLFSNLKPNKSQCLPLSFFLSKPLFFSLFHLPLIWLSPPLRSPVSSLHSFALFARLLAGFSPSLSCFIIQKRAINLISFWVIWQLNNLELVVNLATRAENLPGKHIIFC